jgi:hypothetical protein
MLAACGASAGPSEATIYYDPALRAGVVQPTDAERQLLDRLGEAEPGHLVELGDYVAEAAYAAASGRRCRSIRERAGAAESARLACEADAGWVFVPDVFAGDQP